MAAPFKRLCLRTAGQQTARQWHGRQHRCISSTSSKPAIPQTPNQWGADDSSTAAYPAQTPSTSSSSRTSPSDAELDRLINERPPGVTYTSTEEPDDLGSLEIDALSSQAQRGLATHRELREVVRLAAWEMPRLTALSVPFVAPDPALQPLRWRYTTYMGESHPAESKVVLEFQPQNLPDMTDAQRIKLIKIAGVRYNPNTRTVKMSCESFETQAQNKRFLADTLNALVAESKDPNADTFEDVPYDTRHVKVKERLEFPEEWKMTKERQALLDSKRSEMLRIEASKVEQGQIVSGESAIEEARRVQEEKAREQEALSRREQPVHAASRVGAGAPGRQGRTFAPFPGGRGMRR